MSPGTTLRRVCSVEEPEVDSGLSRLQLSLGPYEVRPAVPHLKHELKVDQARAARCERVQGRCLVLAGGVICPALRPSLNGESRLEPADGCFVQNSREKTWQARRRSE